MIIVEKNLGTKISYRLNGAKITFADEIMLNLARYEADEARHIDICRDAYGALVIGVTTGNRYVAQIDIPPRVYTETAGEPDEHGIPTIIRTPVALDTNTVTLTLWALEG